MTQNSPHPLSRGLVGLIGAASGWGAYKLGTEDGPNFVFKALQESGLLTQQFFWQGTAYASYKSDQITPYGCADVLEIIRCHHKFLSWLIENTIQQNRFPLVIGGDHAMAVSTWGSIAQSMNIREAFGLIWIDAHMDAHTQRTTPSHRYHGMPVAALLGYGETGFVQTVSPGVKIHPEDLILIGVRSFEREERELLESLNVRIYYMDEVTARGLPNVFREVKSHILSRVSYYGISLDLDAFDPIEVPGVGSPAKNGILPEDFLQSFPLLLDRQHLIGFEVAEFNPHLDKNNKTLNLICEIIRCFRGFCGGI